MKRSEDPVELLIGALQRDLPSADDEARARARLVAAGALAASAFVTTSVAANTVAAINTSAVTTATGTASVATAGAVVGSAQAVAAPLTAGMQVGLWSKVVALPLAAKLVSTTAVVATLAVAGVPEFRAQLIGRAPAAVEVQTSQGASAPAPVARVAFQSKTTLMESPVAMDAPLEEVPDPALEPRPGSTPVIDNGAAKTTPPERPAPVTIARSVAAPSSLAEEAPLLEKAMLALQAGDKVRAGYWLKQHERRFPAGALARERRRAAERLQQLP